MTDFDDIIEELKQKRDELRVQIHLASKDVKDEWADLEEKMEEFSGKAKQFSDDAKLKETGEGIGAALGQLGGELKCGYERIRDALNGTSDGPWIPSRLGDERAKSTSQPARSPRDAGFV